MGCGDGLSFVVPLFMFLVGDDRRLVPGRVQSCLCVLPSPNPFPTTYTLILGGLYHRYKDFPFVCVKLKYCRLNRVCPFFVSIGGIVHSSRGMSLYDFTFVIGS